MKCPTDDTVLLIAERQGIEIDFCPTCRGVWLDRGELDKIVERSDLADGDGAARRRDRDDDGYDDDDDDRVGSRGRQPLKRKRKSSFLGELFEFGG
jgi:uncharacterized protein